MYLYIRVHHHQPGDLALQEEDLPTVDLTLAGWRHGTKRGWVARLSYIVLLISSPTILDDGIFTSVSTIASQETWHYKVNCVTVVLTLAGWRHGTKRGPGPRWFIVLLISSPTIL